MTLRDPEAKEHVRVGLAAEISLGVVSMITFLVVGLVLLAVGQDSFGYDFLALAPWLPFLSNSGLLALDCIHGVRAR